MIRKRLYPPKPSLIPHASVNVVETIEGGNQGAGVHVMEIDGDNLPAGNYFYRLQAGTDFTSGTIMKQ